LAKKKSDPDYRPESPSAEAEGDSQYCDVPACAFRGAWPREEDAGCWCVLHYSRWTLMAMAQVFDWLGPDGEPSTRDAWHALVAALPEDAVEPTRARLVAAEERRYNNQLTPQLIADVYRACGGDATVLSPPSPERTHPSRWLRRTTMRRPAAT
jgi:hypothetical protein